MKHIIESIIGRKSSGVGYKLPNPKLKDLQHLDVVKCANGNIYICIDPNRFHGRDIKVHAFDAYKIIGGLVSRLGLNKFYYQDLRCNTGDEDYDITSVYRDIFTNNEDYPNFQTIWDILQERMKEMKEIV